MTVAGEELLGGLFLRVAQRGVERPEGGEYGTIGFDLRLAGADARLHLGGKVGGRAGAARLAERGDRGIPLGGALAQGRGQPVPERRLGVGDLELGAQEGEASLDV